MRRKARGTEMMRRVCRDIVLPDQLSTDQGMGPEPPAFGPTAIGCHRMPRFVDGLNLNQSTGLLVLVLVLVRYVA